MKTVHFIAMDTHGKTTDICCKTSVHHSDSAERMIFKRQVGLYHQRVEHRVSEANQIMGFLKGFGLVVVQRGFSMKEKR
ncbi:MAG: hypothetical protein NTU53_13415 [Planctomycetota bacterium]|nr:hypothetical protein [Planctomycetota bacterium]